MTPERLQEIRAYVRKYDLDDTQWYIADDLLAEVDRLGEYIDLLHEDLRITRAERDAEKKKRAQQSKDHTAEILAWDALAEDTRAKAWDEGYEVGCNDGWHDDYKGTKNPYRKDTK